MISTTVQEYKQIRAALRELIEGVVLSIDPSCGSVSSLPGWAVSRRGIIIVSGVIRIDIDKELPHRLQQLGHELRKLQAEYLPDVLLYEQIAPRRYGGGSAHGHASLLKAVGVTLSTGGPTKFVGLKPPFWTKLKSSTYVKGDEQDAIEMLRIALDVARYIVENDPPRTYSGRGSKVDRPGAKRKKGVTDVSTEEEKKRKGRAAPLPRSRAGSRSKKAGK